MAPPAYSEFGNQAKDIFNKHYRKDLQLKLSFRVKHSNGDLNCNQVLSFNSKIANTV